jgi:predicted HTH domain antitoxin
MEGTMSQHLHVELDIPTLLADQVGLSEHNANREIRRMLALFLYERQRISLGKACELGDMSYWEFADLNQNLQIKQVISTTELEADLTRLRRD